MLTPITTAEREACKHDGPLNRSGSLSMGLHVQCPKCGAWWAGGGHIPHDDVTDDALRAGTHYKLHHLTPKEMRPILAERALAMVLKHEWVGGEFDIKSFRPGSDDDGPGRSCMECGAHEFSWRNGKQHPGKHRPDCEWGRIVAAAKEIG